MIAAQEIIRLKITLDHVEPKVLRRIEVPLNMLLSDLHLAIQAAMPWWNYHLYEFRVRDTRWGLPDPAFDWPGSKPVQPAKKTKLADLIEATGAKSIKYTYDFGDDWEHTIKIEHLFAAEPGILYPRLVEASGRCPPEDAGGPPGYEEYLEAIANPKHERHAEMIQWRGLGFDPKTVDTEKIAEDLAKLARKLNRKPAIRKGKSKQP